MIPLESVLNVSAFLVQGLTCEMHGVAPGFD